MGLTTKERLIAAINVVKKLECYEGEDCIFSIKYAIPPVSMAYILMQLAKEFNFTIGDDFIDEIEMCTFSQLESLLEQYESTTS